MHFYYYYLDISKIFILNSINSDTSEPNTDDPSHLNIPAFVSNVSYFSYKS